MLEDGNRAHADSLHLPLMPMRSGVVFPGTAVALPVGRRRSVTLMRTIEVGAQVVVGVQRDRHTENPSIADLFPIATLARVREVHPAGADQLHVVLEGVGRVQLEAMLGEEPYWRVKYHAVSDPLPCGLEAEALADELIDRVRDLELAMSEELKQNLTTAKTRGDYGRVADIIASALGLPSEKEAEVLLALDINARLFLVHRLIKEAVTLAELRSKIHQDVNREISKHQREAILRQQLKAIQKELGEDDEDSGLDALKRRLAAEELDGDARKVVDRELRRLEQAGGNQAEAGVIRSYLELIADLPWNKRAPVADDLDKVLQKLEQDHAGLKDVKTRILEHLAVRKMTSNNRGAILCFVGPPGVGKTSLGQSIADATGRPYVRASLGGVRDEAEIRGHRRTYVGALPGRILTAPKRAGVKNPVMLLDEIDKVGEGGWLGSPEAALLEVLDPEQNSTFADHYLELPFDLSEVFFICTANSLDAVAPPLRDRLEVIELSGYTLDEKKEIARRHLVPKQLKEHGLTDAALSITDSALTDIIVDYTREAGVRQLQREITRICRSVTLEIARHPETKSAAVAVTHDDIRRYLGKERFFNEVAERTAVPGVATGLAWTPVGGDILFIETSRMPGEGRLEITGQLGDVMKESARAALTFIRSHADALGVNPAFLEAQDLHVHIPAGGVPKDGPSAGVAIFTALTSLLTGKRARSDTAMTGECTLRGRVLPVGGIKTKVLAAHRAGIQRVILPSKNARDLDEVPAEVQKTMAFIFCDEMSQVIAAALEPTVTTLSGSSPEQEKDVIAATLAP